MSIPSTALSKPCPSYCCGALARATPVTPQAALQDKLKARRPETSPSRPGGAQSVSKPRGLGLGTARWPDGGWQRGQLAPPYSVRTGHVCHVCHGKDKDEDMAQNTPGQ